MNEIWKPVLGYEGFYEVSSHGRVKSLVAKTPGLILALYKRKDGYIQVQLKVCQKPNNQLVHRLVDLAFNGPIPEGQVVNHIDGNKGNNNLANLERLTLKENIRHAWKTGLCTKRFGEKAPSSKLSNADVELIRKQLILTNGRPQYGAIKKLANQLQVSTQAISRALHKKTFPSDSRRES